MSIYRAAPELNRLGPPVPVWFRRALKRIDKSLVVQFRPPRSEQHPRGVDPTKFPYGSLEICKKIGRSNVLHPFTIWSLADDKGRPAPPGVDSIRLIKRAYDLKRSAGHLDQMEKELDRYFLMEKKARAAASKEKLVEAVRGYCQVLLKNERQWNHKIYLRRETMEKAIPSLGGSVAE